ncbi:hypothetical protein T4E_1175, partial [Trichinella pseudospiralis]
MVEARGEGPIGGGNCGRPVIRASNGRLPEFEASMHKRSDLDNATKFTYLLSTTQGTARNAIEEIPLTPENYTQ